MMKLWPRRVALCAALAALVFHSPASADVTYTYDDLGRVSSITYDDGKRLTYSYDDAGNRTQHVASNTLGNQPPVAVNDSKSTPQDTPVTFDPRANDSDPDGDLITITAKTNGTKGTVSITAGGGSVVYTPTAGQIGADSFTYTIADTSNATATATVAITITGPNQAPVAVNDTKTAPAGTPTTFDPRANDSDPNGDALTITAKTDGAKGTVSIGAGGLSLTYTAGAGQTGSDSFTYTISDPYGATASATVAVTITAANNPPVAVADSATVAPTVATAINVRANDSDPDSDPLTVVNASTPAKGSAQISGGNVVYTANAGTTGTDTFNYTISDGNGGTATTTVTITINSAPVAVNDSANASPSVPVTIDVRANDSDPDGDTLTVAGTTTPTMGSASVSNNNVVYTANAGANGIDSFTYTVSDGKGGSSSATVTVTVQSNIVALNPGLSVTSGTNLNVLITTLATLNGNAARIFSFTPNCGSRTIAGDGQSVSFTPPTYTYDARCEPRPDPMVCSAPYVIRKTSNNQDTSGTAGISVAAKNVNPGGVCQ